MTQVGQSRPDSGLGFQAKVYDTGRGAARAEDAHGTPTQSHASPNKLVHEYKTFEVVPSLLGRVLRGPPRPARVKSFPLRSEADPEPERQIAVLATLGVCLIQR